MLYDNIKELAAEKNLSITALEQKAKLGNGTIGKWQRTVPKVDSLAKVAFVLDVSIDTLMRDRSGL